MHSRFRGSQGYILRLYLRKQKENKREGEGKRKPLDFQMTPGGGIGATVINYIIKSWTLPHKDSHGFCTVRMSYMMGRTGNNLKRKNSIFKKELGGVPAHPVGDHLGTC